MSFRFLYKCPRCGKKPVDSYSVPHELHLTGCCFMWFGSKHPTIARSNWNTVQGRAHLEAAK